MPIVIALKRKLEEMRSPLIDDLMSYLREIMKDYKNEVKEILSADKQLAAEIQFDLVKWEEEQKKQMANIRRQEEEMVTQFFFSFSQINRNNLSMLSTIFDYNLKTFMAPG